MQHTEHSPVAVTQPGGKERNGRPGFRARTWRRGAFGLGVVAGFAGAALVGVWQRWGQFNPRLGSSARAAAGIPIVPTQHPWYFPMLLLHVIGATIALVACVVQVWPWLRRTHPRVHRYVGRVYVFAGVFPATIFGIVVEVFWPFSAVTAFQQVLLAVLWIFVTTYGFMLARRGRFDDHRRWMLRSFALTTSVLVETAFSAAVDMLFLRVVHTQLAGSKYIFTQVTSATDNWLGMVIAILAVEWWFERERLRHSARRQPLAGPQESTADGVASTIPAS